MTTLRVGEVEGREEPTRLCRVVVRDGGLQVLALGRRLSQLPSQPAQEAHLGLFGHRRTTLVGWTRSWRSQAGGTNAVTGRGAPGRRRRADPGRRSSRRLRLEQAAVDVRRSREPRADRVTCERRLCAGQRPRCRPRRRRGRRGKGAGVFRRGTCRAEHAARRVERRRLRLPQRACRPRRRARRARARRGRVDAIVLTFGRPQRAATPSRGAPRSGAPARTAARCATWFARSRDRRAPRGCGRRRDEDPGRRHDAPRQGRRRGAAGDAARAADRRRSPRTSRSP